MDQMIDMTTLVTVREAAKQVGIGTEAIKTHIWDESLPARKIGNLWYIAKVDLEVFIAKRNET